MSEASDAMRKKAPALANEVVNLGDILAAQSSTRKVVSSLAPIGL